jgi:hypothetical protein
MTVLAVANRSAGPAHPSPDATAAAATIPNPDPEILRAGRRCGAPAHDECMHVQHEESALG